MSKNVLTIFSAEWCVNCKPYKTYLDRLGIDYNDVDIETDKGSKEAARYNVRSLPTSLVEGPDGETLLLEAGTGAIDRVKALMGK